MGVRANRSAITDPKGNSDVQPKAPINGVNAAGISNAAIIPVIQTVGFSPGTVEEILSRASRPDFDRWAEQVTRCGHCSRPVRLRGRVEHRTASGGGWRTRPRVSRTECC
jgi:hypothetical protein